MKVYRIRQTYGNRSYFFGWVGTGNTTRQIPRFGASHSEAAVYLSKEEAVREQTRHSFAFTMTEIVEDEHARPAAGAKETT